MNPFASVGGGFSASASSKSGDQSAAIENGLSAAFIVGDGNKTGASGLSDYLPYALAAAALVAAVLIFRRR